MESHCRWLTGIRKPKYEKEEKEREKLRWKVLALLTQNSHREQISNELLDEYVNFAYNGLTSNLEC